MWHWVEIVARQFTPTATSLKGSVPTVITSSFSASAQAFLPTVTSNPLPTFTPPASCYGPTYTIGPGGNDTYNVAESYVARGVERECYPPVASPYLITSSNSTLYPTFSPGVCPGGHTIANGAVTKGVIAGNNTIATCCPQNFTLSSMSCTSQASNLVVSGSQTVGGNTITLVNGTTTRTTSAVYLRAVAVPIAWNYLDPDPLTSASETPPASAVSGPTSSEATATSTTANSTPSMPGSTISTGAKAGIGIGVALAFILLAVLGPFFWRRRRRGKSTATDAHEATFEKSELPGEGVHRELDGEGVKYESGGFMKPHEVGDNVRAELERDWTSWEAPTVAEFRLHRMADDQQGGEAEERHPNPRPQLGDTERS